MTTDKELEYVEKIGFLKGENCRLEAENRFLWREIDSLRRQAQANWDIVETVACGEKLQCAKCGKYHPCRCDDGK